MAEEEEERKATADAIPRAGADRIALWHEILPAVIRKVIDHSYPGAHRPNTVFSQGFAGKVYEMECFDRLGQT